MAATDPTKMTTTHMREAMRQLRDFQAQRNVFLQQLNAQPRSPRHGRNRIPSPPTHRDSAGGADPAKHGAATLTPSGITYISLTDWASYLAQTGLGADPVEPPKAIPYAGVRVGEIVGYRAWWVFSVPQGGKTWVNGLPAIGWRLQSFATNFIWPPGEIVQGDTGRVVEEWYDICDGQQKQIWGGVYAFRSPELDERTRRRIDSIQAGLYDNVLAIGTCTLWGDVVEHEHGYRASHAKLRSLDAVYGADCLAELQQEYGLRG